MREMTDGDLARVRAAVQLRERCVRAALAHHERVELTPRHEYARATFDAVEQIIRADERAKVAEQIASYRGPDPSPALPAWWAGYTEAIRDAAAIARHATGGDHG